MFAIILNTCYVFSLREFLGALSLLFSSTLKHYRKCCDQMVITTNWTSFSMLVVVSGSLFRLVHQVLMRFPPKSFGIPHRCNVDTEGVLQFVFMYFVGPVASHSFCFIADTLRSCGHQQKDGNHSKSFLICPLRISTCDVTEWGDSLN